LYGLGGAVLIEGTENEVMGKMGQLKI
jgi:hypothetical protein